MNTTQTKLAKGAKVTVYDLPLTAERPEGKATLVTYLRAEESFCGHAFERWGVRFSDSKTLYPRLVSDRDVIA